MSLRLFVALEIPSTVRENFAGFLKPLRALSPQPRWARAENLHVTLKFIGEVPVAKLDAIRAALSTVRSDREVTIDFRGLGFFPDEKHARVFWAGLDASPNLKTLALHIDQATEKLRTVMQENAARDFGSLRTNQFHLIESKLKPSGADYTTLESFPFVVAEA